MDWVHCNTCFFGPSSKLQFNLTSCGHIFCSLCLQKNTDKICKTCEQKYTGVVTLTNAMKPDVQMYFMDIKDLHKNILKQVQQVQLVAEFQKGHSQRLSSYQKQKLGRFSELMSQAKELERKYKETLYENDKLKRFLVSKGFQLTEIIGTSSNSSNFPKTPRFPGTPGNSTMRSLSNSSINNNKMPSTPNIQRFSRSLNHPSSPMHSRTMNHNPSPIGSMCRGLQRTMHGQSSISTPRQNSSMVAPGRITMRTPPVNGKIGPIATSPSLRNPSMRSPLANFSTPMLNMSSQLPRPGQSYYDGSLSKIGQNLSGPVGSTSNNTPINNSLSATPLEERRPIQLNSSRALPFPKQS